MCRLIHDPDTTLNFDLKVKFIGFLTCFRVWPITFLSFHRSSFTYSIMIASTTSLTTVVMLLCGTLHAYCMFLYLGRPGAAQSVILSVLGPGWDVCARLRKPGSQTLVIFVKNG